MDNALDEDADSLFSSVGTGLLPTITVHKYECPRLLVLRLPANKLSSLLCKI